MTNLLFNYNGAATDVKPIFIMNSNYFCKYMIS